ncbi:MAG: RNA methyltransferase [Cyanobacteria bacterium]|nr:RNA methyltransferase [Cyanobacteriota bacterium]MDA0865261.1 RNA methyltransferase [Cyanobacteriota bacterium]
MPNPIPRHPLILCASLVQNPMNLGALCRTAEVLGLAQLVLPNLDVVENWQFRQLAASAHHWQPLTACPPDQLPQWLEQQRADGVACWALTAHPQGQPLPTFTFPQRTVLILGRELTGIPPEVLDRCEGAIWIPQLGRVNSLNVHTAGAIAAYS